MFCGRGGQLIVADAALGLLSISPEGDIEVLADSVAGDKMLFVDDLDIAADGTIWFSDASARYDYHHNLYDFLEGRSSGSKAGQRDLFHPGQPGTPDNLSFNGSDTFWVAMPAVARYPLR